MNMDELRKMGNYTSPRNETDKTPQTWWQDSFWKRLALAVVVLLALSTAFSFYVVYSSMQETKRLSSFISVPK